MFGIAEDKNATPGRQIKFEAKGKNIWHPDLVRTLMFAQ